jgi:hypothetical protein
VKASCHILSNTSSNIYLVKRASYIICFYPHITSN